MAGSLLIDTDALISVGNTDCWKTVFHEVGLTTTYVVKGELERHVEQGGGIHPKAHRTGTDTTEADVP